MASYNYARTVYDLISMMRHVHWSADRLREYQNGKVRAIAKHAYDNVPFYHKEFENLGLKPYDIKTVEDLNKLPIIGKEDVRKNLEKMMSREFDVRSLRKVSTSGSTGTPLFIYIDRKEDEIRKVGHLRANMGCGQKPRDRWVGITPHENHHEVPALLRFLNIFSLTSLSVFDDPSTQAARLEKLKPDVIEGYSTSLQLIANYVEKEGIETIKPRLILGGAELIVDSSRRFIEKVFDAPFYDQYASTEFGRMACQCPAKKGYHIEADSLVMQFVDENGEEVANGESGEIVCTSLHNYAMPIIRYTMNDVGIPSEETDCPCKRAFPLMKVMEGRKDSIIFLPDGRELSPLVIGDGMIFFEHFDCIDQYRLIQKRLDFFKILVKKNDCGVEDKVMESGLVAHFRKLLKVDESAVTIEVEFVDEIKLDRTGKLMKIVSELKK